MNGQTPTSIKQLFVYLITQKSWKMLNYFIHSFIYTTTLIDHFVQEVIQT